MIKYIVMCYFGLDSCRMVKQFYNKDEAIAELNKLLENNYKDCNLYAIRVEKE